MSRALNEPTGYKKTSPYSKMRRNTKKGKVRCRLYPFETIITSPAVAPDGG